MKWIFYCLMVLLLAMGVVASEYEYISVITVSCEEYEGYVQFDLPDTFTNNAYMNQTVWIAEQQTRYTKQPNWFVKSITSVPASSIEKIQDEDFASFLILEGSKVTLPFENPDTKTVQRIRIDTTDSVIDSIDLSVPFTLTRSGFHYELELKNPVQGKKITLTLEYDDVLKIREISFFQKENVRSERGYFYVDNDCNQPRFLYFGRYGQSNVQRGAKSLPVYFETKVLTQKNIEYDPDFDDDGVLNDNDNCLKVPNVDQKDINYNRKGDVCDDGDGDGIINSEDNCPDNRNRNQYDEDGDGTGDACDEQDNRFFEENAVWVYVFAGIIVIVFLLISFNLVRKK